MLISKMKRLLVLFSSSFPFGQGETFLGAEFPFLEKAFDEVLVISNDISSPQTWPAGPTVSCRRVPYDFPFSGKVLALGGLLLPLVWREFAQIRRRHPGAGARRVLSTILTSWAKAKKYATLIADISASHPHDEVYAYSYWANDAAVAVALARKRGLVQRATSRAHGWDVYTSRPEVGFLPFRDFLATHLDTLAFVSADGRRFFENSVGRGRATLEVMPLGTPAVVSAPVGRSGFLTVVSCSGLIPLKRIGLMASAVMKVRNAIRWIHLGDGPERALVESICSSPPRGVEVTLMGQIPHDQVIETLRRLRPWALINVSATEGLPVSMMEAMSLGIPVIGTRVGGVPEIVNPGVNGYLLSADPDPEEIVSTLNTLAGLSDSDFEVLARGAWQTWNERFRADRNYTRFVDRLLGSGGDVDTPRLHSSGSGRP